MPAAGTDVMDGEQAAKASKVLEPTLSTPMHYGTEEGEDQDTRHFKHALEGRVDVRILPPPDPRMRRAVDDASRPPFFLLPRPCSRPRFRCR